MKYLPLTRGLVALVDDDDYDWLAECKWMAMQTKPGVFYAARNLRLPENWRKHITILMHREILGLPRAPGVATRIVGDHINLDTLDNRRSNLRAATRRNNQFNRRGAQKNSSTGIRGVCPDRSRGIWIASFGRERLGDFARIEDAVAARRRAESDAGWEMADA